MDQPSFVVTGGARGVGRSIAHRLAQDGQVVVLDVIGAPDWDDPSIQLVSGDARDPLAAREAAQRGEARGPLSGWVNNAAVFGDAGLASASAHDVLGLITTNLALALVGCHVAVNHYLNHNRAGGIVNVSSHQARRPVRGALPYATAKAGIEGLTRAIAVDHGPQGIRTNAVALGTISTARYESYRSEHPEVEAQMTALHPLGRVGTGNDVAEAVAFLLSPQAAFINGVVLPIDGGRAVLGTDPEATDT